MNERLEDLGRRFARLATRAVVARPALWRVFRGPLRMQFDRLAPVWDSRRGPEALAPLWMLLKILVGAVLFIWVRATLPRLRYDQLMSFGWKILLPLATLNVLATAIVLVVT